MYKFSIIDKISFILVIAGALNWGLLGLFNCDLIEAILGDKLQYIARIVYILVGVAGIDMILFLVKAKRNKI